MNEKGKKVKVRVKWIEDVAFMGESMVGAILGCDQWKCCCLAWVAVHHLTL